MAYESFDDYWEPLLGGQGPFGSYVAGLPDEHRAVVRAAVRDACRSGGPDGPRSLAATAWAVRGRVPQGAALPRVIFPMLSPRRASRSVVCAAIASSAALQLRIV